MGATTRREGHPYAQPMVIYSARGRYRAAPRHIVRLGEAPAPRDPVVAAPIPAVPIGRTTTTLRLAVDAKFLPNRGHFDH